MALDGFTIGGASSAAPAKAAAAVPASGPLAGFKIGAQAPAASAPAPVAPQVQALVDKTPAAPDTKSFFSKVLDFFSPPTVKVPFPGTAPKATPESTATKNPYVINGLDYSNTYANPDYMAKTEKELTDQAKTIDTSDPAAVKAYNAKLDQYNTQSQAKQNLQGFFNTHDPEQGAANYDENVIKLPLGNWGVDLNSNKFFQENPLLTSILKGVVELPERAIRTLGEGADLSKPLSGYSIYGGLRQTKPTKYQVPSYAEAGTKTTDQLIEQGVPVTAAVILGSAAAAGDFANNALIYEGALSAGSKAITRSLAIPTESQAVAYDFLGQPKTMVEAEKNFKAIQREFHPDKVGASGQTFSAKANEAIGILREEGIPSTTKFKQGINALLNKPVSELFGGVDKVPAGIKPTMPIKGYLEAQNPIHEARSALNEEINQAIQVVGEDVTHTALVENLGVDASAATKMIQNAKSAAVLEAPEKMLQLAAPEKQLQIGASNFKPQKTSEEMAIEEKVITSIKEKGGVTINVNGAEPSKGFSYAPAKDSEFSVPEKDFHANAEKYYDQFYEKNKELLSDPENHIGGWVDGGRVYLDVSRVGDASAETIAKAQEAQQLGVYDLEHGKTIPTGQLAEGGKGEYTPVDEATNVYDKHQREISGTSEKGGPSGSEKIQTDQGGSGEASPKFKPVGGGEKVASELASGIEARAIEKKLTDKPFEVLSTHERAVMSEQRAGAEKLYAEDRETALKVALGEENAPKGLLPSVIYEKVVLEAEKAGDIDLMLRLANSPYNDEVTAMAQNLRGHAEFRDKLSPTKTIKDVNKAIKEKTIKGAKAKTVTQAKTKIVERAKKQIAKKKSPIQMKQVEEFISLLEC